jgi:hypothetical protein
MHSYDKNWTECLTLAQLNQLKGQSQNSNSNLKRAADVPLNLTRKKLQKQKKRPPPFQVDRGHMGVSLDYTQADLENVAMTSQIFQGTYSQRISHFHD